MRAVLDLARSREWWEHKLPTVAGTGYASAYVAGIPLHDALASIAIVLLALLPGAVYVSVLNDWTDRDVDARAGKPSRSAGRPAVAAVGIGAALSVGALIAVLAWRHQPAVVGLYAGAWIAFGLYSAPPARLKARGFAGVCADAAGAHLFPQLLMVAAVVGRGGHHVSAAWPLAVGVWAAAHGLRGALWHQLSDVDADERAGIRTFAQRHPRGARQVGARVVFPVELAAFATMLVVSGGVIAAGLLLPYAFVAARWTKRLGHRLVVVGGAPPFRIALHEYYRAHYPIGFVAAAVLRHPRDAVVLVVQVVLFPRSSLDAARDLYHELTSLRHPWRSRRLGVR